MGDWMVRPYAFGQFRFRMFGEYSGKCAEAREILLNP